MEYNSDPKWLRDDLLRKSEGSYVIGRLFDKEPIRQSNDFVRIFIDPLCLRPTPEYNLEADLSSDYLAIDRFQNILPYNYDPYGYNIKDRIEQWEDLLYDKLVIFNPVYNEKPDGRIFKNATIVQLINDSSDYYSFDLIPQVNTDPTKFEETLMSGDYFELPYYDSEIYESPEIIKCGNYFYRIKDISKDLGILESSPDDPTRWRRSVDPKNIVKVDVSSLANIDKYIIKINDTDCFLFIGDKLRNKINTCKEFLGLGEKAKVIESQSASDQEDVQVDKSKNDPLKTKRENDFIIGLNELSIEKKLLYSMDDLINFHTSIKTNPLTILAGMSGTGKSKLADNYARMLDLSEDNNTLLFMPISPSYTEPSDVLGFYNNLDNIYVPSETGLVDFLVHANKVKNKMHMVIFDEMNLSQVEYWFSPFISALEKEPNERYLKLYDENLKPKNLEDYPYRIKINNNVIFVGTVNIDETTKDFSDRLLDRTFIVNLQKETFD